MRYWAVNNLHTVQLVLWFFGMSTKLLICPFKVTQSRVSTHTPCSSADIKQVTTASVLWAVGLHSLSKKCPLLFFYFELFFVRIFVVLATTSLSQHFSIAVHVYLLCITPGQWKLNRIMSILFWLYNLYYSMYDNIWMFYWKSGINLHQVVAIIWSTLDEPHTLLTTVN